MLTEIPSNKIPSVNQLAGDILLKISLLAPASFFLFFLKNFKFQNYGRLSVFFTLP